MGIIAKQSIRGTIWTYIGVLVGIITVFLVQSRLPMEMGLARVLVDAATIFIGLAQMGTSSSIIRFFPSFKSKENNTTDNSYHGFFFWSLIVPLIGFMLFTLLYWALQVPLQSMFADKSPLFVDYYYFVLPLAFFFLYQTIFETNSNVLMHIVFPRAIREVVTRVGLLATYLLYYFNLLSIDGFVISLCSVYALCAICNAIYFLAIGHVSFRPDFRFLNRSLVRSYLLYTGFMILTAAVSVFAPVLSSFFVAAKLGLEETGIFAMATYIAAMICIPSRAMNAISQPQISQSVKDCDYTQTSTLLRQVSSNLFLVGCLIFLAIWINIDLIFHIIPNGDIYATARNVVFILCLSQLCLSSFGISLSAVNFSRLYILSLVCSLLLTTFSIILNNHLIPLIGINGAALANLISYLIYFALLLIIVRLVLHTNILTLTHLWTILLLAGFLALNKAWCLWFSPAINNIWIDSILRTIILFGGLCATVYFAQLSKEINALLHNFFIRRN